MRSAPRALLAGGAALLLIAWQLQVASKAGVLYGDFHAFYCAAHAVLQGVSPYTASALHSCESAPVPHGFSYAPPAVVVPAPLPGYALVAFTPFAALPYAVACAVWLAVVLLCVTLSARALAILVNRPADLMLWTLLTGFAVASISTGELGPPMIAAVLWMGVAMRRGAWAFAAIAGAVSMLVPHVGLSAMLAAFILVPRMRIPIAIAAAVLAALDILAGGMQTALSYFVEVLPAHARSEIGSSMQYGMTWILHGLRLPDRIALLGGELSYAAMLVLGIATARVLIRRTQDAAYTALVPPAFVVIGGTFIHYTQIMIAIPAALLLYEQSEPGRRRMFAGALLLLACPWMWVVGEPSLLFVYAALCGTLTATVLRWSVSASLRIALAAALLGGVVLAVANYFGPAYATHSAAGSLQPGLAQSSWAQFVQSHWASTGIAWWVAKAPTWVGLALLALGCALVLMKKDFVAPVVIEQVPVAS